MLLPLAVQARFVVEDRAVKGAAGTAHYKVLRNEETDEHVEVCLEAGGHTEGLRLKGSDGKLRSVLLDNHHDAAKALAGDWSKGMMLVPYANRVKNGTYSFEGKHYQLRLDEFNGPIWGNNSIHGYLRDKTMKVVAAHEHDSHATLILEHRFDGSDPGYPFPLLARTSYRLDADGFSLTFHAVNEGEAGALPYMCSWHPYFKVDDIASSSVVLDQRYKWEHLRVSNDSYTPYSDQIPTGKVQPFSGFNGSAPIGMASDGSPFFVDDGYHALGDHPDLEHEIRDPAKPDAIVIRSDASFKWAQVFTGIFRNNESAIALEPMSGETNCYNSGRGLISLAAGQAWNGTIHVSLKKAAATAVVV